MFEIFVLLKPVYQILSNNLEFPTHTIKFTLFNCNIKTGFKCFIISDIQIKFGTAEPINTNLKALTQHKF